MIQYSDWQVSKNMTQSTYYLYKIYNQLNTVHVLNNGHIYSSIDNTMQILARAHKEKNMNACVQVNARNDQSLCAEYGVNS